MNIKTIILTAISYLFTFFAGVYGLCLVDGEIDFFMVFGFIACMVVAALTSPFLMRVFKKSDKREKG